ncbi:hypothetical protein SISNIDRAFT_447961 [Sistotremastrum niveocremeum HHB9708]|uniref:RING-type E3 ubiquitin transferase n=1 Tax=Sistotremastrum niveocremeum HHB9708 TaxID=1314777 RepID=A0A165AJQ1_9AGAM|nr:hypothetical protein SISNIDRAFT_447961 [Sistotremastrum niveocremeum HHB9708]
MATQTATQQNTRGNNRNRNRGPGRSARRPPNTNNDPPKTLEEALPSNETPVEGAIEAAEDAVTSDVPTCWICAEPVKYWSVAECNHRTCHVCALRLRALYKKMDCTFCKHPQPIVIFTESEEKKFAEYTPDLIPFKDPKLSISFETQEMMEESLFMLRFNCPDIQCDFIARGWNDLKMHVRASHGKQLCDVCIRHKKVFAHEQLLYTYAQLAIHLPSLPRRGAGGSNVKQDKTDTDVHPMCEFCRECFFGDDELFAHMRETHEECFICKRNGVRDQYFLDYNGLEKHFTDAHYPCTHPNCLAQKFVVFNSQLDLKGHSIETHGEDMSTRDKKDAKRVVAGFDFEDVGPSGARGNRRRNPESEDTAPPEPNRSRRRENFGARLTPNVASTNSFPQLSSNRPTPSPRPETQESTTVFATDVDSQTLERHANFLARVNSLTANSSTALTAIKSAIRSFRASESGPRDLISTFFNVLNQDLDPTASLVNSLVDLLDDEEKGQNLLSAWNGFKIEQQQQFPDLSPVVAGSEYVGIASGRALNVKKSVSTNASSTAGRRVLDRVARAATSGSATPGLPRQIDRFPPLQSRPETAPYRQGQRVTPWASSSQTSVNAPATGPSLQSSSVPRPNGNAPNRPKPPQLSAALFPSLPSQSQSTAVLARNLVNRNKTNDSPQTNSAWGPASAAGGGDEVNVGTTEGSENAPRGKKKKGKEKQTLFTLGSFPT